MADGGTPNRPAVRPRNPRRVEKSAMRAAKKRAAARARRRRQVGAVGGAVVGVLAVIVLVVFLVRSGGSNTDAAASPSNTASASSSASSASACPNTPAKPTAVPIPADADPALKTKPKVGKGEGDLTKLNVTALVQGKGAEVQKCQMISVNYVGVSYKTGDEFDASWKRNEPFSFQIGLGNVIQGWDQGLVGVKVGSRVQLDIPANLAYGEQAQSGPSGPLRFVVDVLAAAS
jgi:peptidylprolyl isomerase